MTSNNPYIYPYVLNNPLKFTDPSGYRPVGIFEEETRMTTGSYNSAGSGWDPFGWISGPTGVSHRADPWGGWTYNWGTKQYENRANGSTMDQVSFSSSILPGYLRKYGADTYTNITSMHYENSMFQFTSVPTPTRLVSNMQMWYNPSTSTMLHYDKSANEFYVPHTSTLFSDYMQSLAATKEGGFVFGSPVSEIVTGTASAVSLIRALRNFLKSPIIQTHYGGVKAKHSRSLGRLGTAGDVASTSMSVWNISQNPSNPQYYFDAFSAGMGFVPVYGDLAAIFYTGLSNLLNSVVTNPDNLEYWEEHPGAYEEFLTSGIRSY